MTYFAGHQWLSSSIFFFSNLIGQRLDVLKIGPKNLAPFHLVKKILLQNDTRKHDKSL